MNKQQLVLIACGTFLTFAFLLGIGIALDARDSANYLESDIQDLRGRVDDLEYRSR
ncbi:MAG: hypothetical protein IH784_09890 [Bacteroidetes bacterium]|nr:hypothetical protein [Bacteroidota bacterium]